MTKKQKNKWNKCSLGDHTRLLSNTFKMITESKLLNGGTVEKGPL